MPQSILYRYRATEDFWHGFYALPAHQNASVRRAWEIFKADPFDPRLGAHKIHRLSAHYKTTIYSVRVEADLRVVFYLKGDEVWTLEIGTHDLYKR
jgi:Txe/YoeB family toxin of Txe-Axe toxin-antitoxin module